MIYYARLSIKKGRTIIKRRQLTGNHTLGIESEISEGPDFTEIKSADPRIIERFIAVWKSKNEHVALNGVLVPFKAILQKANPLPRQTPKRDAIKALVKELRVSGQLAATHTQLAP